MKIEKTALLALGAAMTSGAALASNTVDKATIVGKTKNLIVNDIITR